MAYTKEDIKKRMQQREEKPSLSSSAQMTKDDVKMRLAQRELNALGSSVSNANNTLSKALGGWNDAASMQNFRNTIQGASDSVNSYIAKYADSMDVDTRSGLNKIANTYSNALNSWNDTTALYERYKNADAFNSAMEIAKQNASKPSVFDSKYRNLVNNSDFNEKSTIDDYGMKTNIFGITNLDWNNKDSISRADFNRNLGGPGLAIRDMDDADVRKKVGQYIFNTQGAEAYNQYMSDIQEEYGRDKYEADAEKAQAYALEHPVASILKNNFENLLLASASAGQTLEQEVAFGKSDKNYGANAKYALNREEEAALIKHAEEKYPNAEILGYNVAGVGMKALTSGISSRIGQAVFGEGYNVIMGMGAFASTYQDAKERGLDEVHALTTAFVAGGVEWATEQLGMEWAFGDGGKIFITNLLKQAGAEGAEELVGDFLNNAFDLAYNGSDSELLQEYNDMIARGFTESEARAEVAKNYVKNTVEGAIVAAISTVPQGTVHGARVANAGSQIDSEMLAQYAKNKGGDAYDLYKDYIDNNKLSNWQKGVIYGEYVNQNRQDLKAASVARDVDKFMQAEDNATVLKRMQKTKTKTDFKTTKEGEGIKATDVVNEEGRTYAVDSEGVMHDLSEEAVTVSQAVLYENASAIEDEDVRKLYLDYEGQDVDGYTRNFDLAYEMAARGIPLKEIQESVNFNAISSEKVTAIYEKASNIKFRNSVEARKAMDIKMAKWSGEYRPGKLDTSSIDMNSLSKTEKSMVKFLELFSKMGMNIKVVSDDSEVPDGDTLGNQITINLKARYWKKNRAVEGKYAYSTFAHESTHWMSNILGAEFDTFKAVVQQTIGMRKWNDFVALEINNANYDDEGNLVPEDQRISQEIAEEEAIARICEDMLNDPKAVERILASASDSQIQRLINAVKSWFENIKKDIEELLKGYSSVSTEAQYLKGMEEQFKTIQDAWVEMFERALKANQALVEESMEALQANDTAHAEEVLGFEVKATPKNSLKLDDSLGEKSIKANNTNVDPTTKEKKMNVDPRVLTNSIAQRKGIARALRALERFLPEDIEGNALTKNGSYGRSVEHALICVRSLVNNWFVDKVANEIGRPLTAEEQIVASEILAGKVGNQRECQYCYVAADRRSYKATFKKYLDDYNDLRSKAINNKEAYASELDYLTKNYSRIKDQFKVKDTREAFAKSEAKNIPGLTEYLAGRAPTVNMLDRYMHIVSDAVNGVAAIDPKRFSTETIRQLHRNDKALGWYVKDATSYAKAATKAKLTYRDIKVKGKKMRLEYVAYNGNILNMNPDLINHLNGEYGLRLYSDSDYVPAFLLEDMQIVTDAAVKGLKMLAYTKDMGFAKVFAPTEMNINISTYGVLDEAINNDKEFEKAKAEYLINQNDKTRKAYLDALSKYVIYDGMQGADWEETKDLRKEYKNISAIFVATNDDLVEWAMAQDWIDVVIPYHTVFAGLETKEYFKYSNYKDVQGDRKTKEWQEGMAKSIPPTIHENDYKKYKDALGKNGLTARFAKWENNPNYMKLVNETRLPYTKSQPVQPKFDWDAAEAEIARIAVEGKYGFGQGMNSEEDQERMFGEDAKKAVKLIASGKISRQDVDDFLSGKTKYSKKVDSDGNALTVNQEKFFERSKARDKDGNLLVMYHGTANSGAFNVFEGSKLSNSTESSQIGQGFYFTNVKEEAESYMKNVDVFTGKLSQGSNPYMFKTYLNIENPFDVNKDTLNTEDVKKVFNDGDYQYFFDSYIPFYLNNKTVNGKKYTRAEVSAMSKEKKVDLYVDYYSSFGQRELLREMVRAFKFDEQDKLLESMKNRLGYDGFVDEFSTGKYQYVALSSNQIKSVTNENPTENPDIRYARKVDEAKMDADYMAAVNASDMKEAQKMVNAAARRAGYNHKVYHGTGRGGFTVFNTKEIDNNMGSHFGSKAIAKGFVSGEFGGGGDNPKVYGVFIKAKNPFETYDWFGQDDFYPAGIALKLADEIGTKKAYDIIDDIMALDEDLKEEMYNMIDAHEYFPNDSGYLTSEQSEVLYSGLRKLLKMAGYDSIHYENGLEMDEWDWIIQDPENIKSADPVTYDDNGNIIPLSERFKTDNPDIRYARKVSEAEEKAIKAFGTTTDFAEAGYILSNGQMLKFTTSDKPGDRDYDHRAIAIAYGKDIDLKKNHGFDMNATPYLERFVEEGAIRLDAGSLDLNMDMGIQLSSKVPLTPEQEQTVRELVEWKMQREEMYNPDDDPSGWSLYSGPLRLMVEFGGSADYAVGGVTQRDLDAWHVPSIEYAGAKISPYKVIADIRHYYETGEINKPSELAQFRYSKKVTDKKTLDFLNKQIEDGDYITTYKSMRLDGYDKNGMPILHSPMAALINGKYENEYKIGEWYQAVEHPESAFVKIIVPIKERKEFAKKNPELWKDLVKTSGQDTFFYAEQHPELIQYNKNGEETNLYFNLDKGKNAEGKSNGDLDARYNPYEHSSNSVFNDQFKGAYERPELVTVEMRVPKSEATSGYKAKFAKDPVGWTEWKSGDVSRTLAKYGKRRDVFLSRYAMAVRVLDDAEVAQKYKETLDGTGIKVPDNVVTPNLLNELMKAGVEIEKTGKVKYANKVLDLNNPSIIHIDDLYDNVPKQFRGAKINMEDNIDPFEMREVIDEVRHMAEKRKKKHKSMKFPFDIPMGDHRYIGENITYDDFRTFEIVNINVDEDIAKGVKFYGRDEALISEIISGIGDDESFYNGDYSVSSYGERSEKNAVLAEEETSKNRRRDPGDFDRSEGIQKFSNKVNDPDIFGQNKRLETENEKLKADVERLKNRLKIERVYTKGKKLDDHKIELAARVILKEARSTYDEKKLAEGLKDVYQYIIDNSNGEILWDEIMNKAAVVARKVLDASKPEKITDDYFKGILREIRAAKIKLTDEQIQEVKSWYGDDWRRDFLGKIMLVKEGRSLDSYWSEWSSMHPDVFDPNTNPNDQVTAILDIYDEMKELSTEYVRYNDNESVRALAIEIYNKFWNVPTVTTLTDKHKAEINKLKADHKQAIKELKDSNTSELAKMKQDQKLADDIYYGKKISKEKEFYQNAIKKVRADKDRRFNQYKEYKKDQQAKMRDAIARKKLVDKIMVTSKTLFKWIDENSKDHHIPKAMLPVVKQLLGSIDFSSKQLLGLRGGSKAGMPTKSDVSFREAMDRLRNLIIQSSTEEGMAELGGYIDFPADYQARINTLCDEINKTAAKIGADNIYIINEMNVNDLTDLYDIVKTIKHLVQTMNVTIAGANKVKISDTARNTINYSNKLGDKKNRSKLNAMFEFSNSLPIYTFERMGEGAMRMFEGVQDGWDKFAFNIKKVINDAKGMFNSQQEKDWTEHSQEVTLMILPTEQEMKEGAEPHEETIRITDAQIMSLYCLSKRDHAIQHMYNGGICIAEFDDKTHKVVQSRNYRLNAAEVNKLIGLLSKEQIEVADKIQNYMNTVCKDWGNEVSMKRYGIEGFKEENYFPIKVDQNGLPVNAQDREKSVYALLNMGFTKPINPRAKNPIEIGNIFDVFTIHASEMAKYNSIALPVLDMVKWFSFTEKQGTDIVGTRKSLLQAFGKDANTYIRHFLNDLNGMQESGRGEGIMKKLTRSYKTAAVAANMQVMALQPISILRATAVMDEKYIFKGMASVGKIKYGMEMCQKYSGIAVWKSLSLFDTNVSRGIDAQIRQNANLKDKAIELSMKGAEMADEITWGAIWNACEYETRAKNKGLEGEALYQATAKRFRDVVYRTQVVDSTMTRTDVMRSSNLAAKWATSFMSEPSVTMNLFQNMIYKYLQDRREVGYKEAVRRNKRNVLKVGEAFLLTSIVEAALRGAFSKVRHPEDDEEYLRLLWEEFKQNLNLANNIPLLRDAMSLAKGYDVARPDVEFASNIVSAFNGFAKNGLTYKNLYKAAQSVSQFTGIPISSAMREFVAMLELLTDIEVDK